MILRIFPSVPAIFFSTDMQPLDRFQYLDQKHSLRARTALSFAISLFRYVLLWDCLIVFVSTINTFTAHSFVELRRNLSTAGNALTGSIPSELGHLSALQYLDLGTCFFGIVWHCLLPLSMVSLLTPLLNCVSQPLDRFQYLDRKHSLRARTALSFAISLVRYVLLGGLFDSVWFPLSIV